MPYPVPSCPPMLPPPFWHTGAKPPWYLTAVEWAHYALAAPFLAYGILEVGAILPDLVRDLLSPPLTTPPRWMVLQVVFGAPLIVFGVVTLRSGRWIARRTRRGMSLAWAGVQCLTGIGLLVGLPTLFVLTRKRVVGAYQAALGLVPSFPVFPVYVPDVPQEPV